MGCPNSVNVAVFQSSLQAWPWTWDVGSAKREEMDASRAWQRHWEWTCGPLVPDLVRKSTKRQSEETLRPPTPLPTQGHHCRSPSRAQTLLSQGCCPSQTWRDCDQTSPSSLILHPTPCRATRSLSLSVTFRGSLWPRGIKTLALVGGGGGVKSWLSQCIS